VKTTPRERRPEKYRLAADVAGLHQHWAFEVTEPADYDWLESAILEDGYYEHGGVWTLEPDLDKQIMGELLASVAPAPSRALELGCSSGTVLRVLRGFGVDAEGIDISRFAYERAHPDIRDHIHLGDLLEVALPSDYDLVYGLDIFEHLNPNRLDRYLAAARARIGPGGGWLVANIPAYGADEVFGQAFQMYLPEWFEDMDAERPFRLLHCDEAGYPMHGHLTWAHTTWWVTRFTEAGFARRPDAERPLQEKFAEHLAAEPARRSIYLFATEPA
jgi:hypothetical protein